MRVALDANPLFGPRTGVGTYVANLAAALAQLPNGPEVVLPTVSLRASGRAPAIPGTTTRHRRAPFSLVQALWDRGTFPPAEWLLGRPDLFHATNFVAPPFRRTPLVTTIHDLSYERYPEQVDRRVSRYREWVPDAIRRSRILITPAVSTADEIAEFYAVPRDSVVAVHHGVDPAWFDAAPPDAPRAAQLGLPDRYLVFVGAPTERKNIDLLLRAHRAARSGDGVVPPLVLAGPSPAAEVLRAVAPSEDVRWIGYLEDGHLRQVVAGATALLYPSRYEGFGLPILEALAAGTPVVASDTPVHREVAGGHARLVDVEAGELQDRRDRLAEALTAVALAAPPAEERAAGRAWAASFTWERTARATVAAYTAALA